MKEKAKSNRASKNNLKSSASNLFLNLIIFLLGAIIIFMAYSLILKLKNNTNDVISRDTKKVSAIIQVEVLNGCGVSGIADKMSDYLRKNNFDVVQLGNYTSFDMDKSLVIDRTGNKANAEKVAEALGISKKNIIQQINEDYLLDCSVVIGKDYLKLKPYK